MSIKVMSNVWARSKRKDGELLVMLALADFASDSGECWPSLEVLALKARLTKSQLCKVLTKLEESGEIVRQRSSGGRNRRSRYRISLPENGPETTLLKERCKNNSVFEDPKTVSPARHAINRHRTVSRESTESAPTPKKKTASDPAVKVFLDWWAKKYQDTFGVRYDFNGTKEGALMKAKLGTFSIGELQELATRFFGTGDRWIREQGGFTIGVFCSQINKINSTTRRDQVSSRKELRP